MWNDIDSQNKGKVTRDEMFNHLKYARDIEIPTEVVEATSPGVVELNNVRRCTLKLFLQLTLGHLHRIVVSFPRTDLHLNVFLLL